MWIYLHVYTMFGICSDINKCAIYIFKSGKCAIQIHLHEFMAEAKCQTLFLILIPQLEMFTMFTVGDSIFGQNAFVETRILEANLKRTYVSDIYIYN